MKYIIFILTFLIVTINAKDIKASDEEVIVEYGVGIANSAKNSPGETKVGFLNYRYYLVKFLYVENRIGYWGDGSSDVTRKNSFYVSSGLGYKINFNWLELYSGWGLGAISTPDSYLGDRIPQFNNHTGIMLRDSYGAGIGVSYNHVSSAGLAKPNLGRDFMTLSLSLLW